ncbi:MAG TPA: BON domain-containing protein [Verrucomicrobiae bacterium]|nr:BON domain-containing protein [Verrucomicrobiae bacterium]
MKNSLRRTIGFLGAALLAVQLFGTVPANAGLQNSSSAFEQATPVTPAQKEVDRLLKQISANAAAAANHADRLDSFARVGSRISYSTHAAELTGAKTAINAMGADFRRLHELRPGALPWQQLVIDRIEPVLVGMAGHATNAIERLNAGRGKLMSQDYRDAVGNLYSYAEQARTHISVNLDYAQAREKLNRLDASPSEPIAKVSAREAVGKSAKASRTLEQRVRSSLLNLPYYGVFDHLAFQVVGDQVLLTGDVSWPALKTDAERTVRNVEGVAGVTSDVKVLPLSVNDNRIRLATYRAIYGQPALSRYSIDPHPPIRIIVENGHVTLKGVVGNEMDRTMAFMQANRVPGVFSVTNHLQLGI